VPKAVLKKGSVLVPEVDDTWYDRPEGVLESHTAGGIVVRVSDGNIFIALAREKIFDEFVLPKGHVETGESIVAAARREIAEEVGIRDLTLIEKLGFKTRLDFRRTEWKITHYFLYVTRQQDAIPEDKEQHGSMHWVPLLPIPKLFWPEQQALLTSSKDRILAVASRIESG
jgi:8-oxo-dGTP pyrophosphatase MutT (NUDIX family)